MLDRSRGCRYSIHDTNNFWTPM